MEGISFRPAQHPYWRPKPHMSTAAMVCRIQEYVDSFDAEDQNKEDAVEVFKRKVQVHFIHSVCCIEGESLDSVEHSLQAIELWRCCKDLSQRRCESKGTQKLTSEARGSFSVSFERPIKNGSCFLTIDLGVAGFDTFIDTEACLRGVSSGGVNGGVNDRMKGSDHLFNQDKLHATLALNEALSLVQAWERHPYPVLDVLKIKQLHFILFTTTATEGNLAGVYRSASVWTWKKHGDIRTYLSYKKIPRALNDLVKKVNKTIAEIFAERSCTSTLLPRLLNVVSWFFLEFESIHPFHDGNGRVGRLLAAYLLSPFTPFGPNVLYFHSNLHENINKPSDMHDNIMFVDRETFLEAIQDDDEEGYPKRVSALIIEGIYVAWKMFRSCCSVQPLPPISPCSSRVGSGDANLPGGLKSADKTTVPIVEEGSDDALEGCS